MNDNEKYYPGNNGKFGYAFTWSTQNATSRNVEIYGSTSTGSASYST